MRIVSNIVNWLKRLSRFRKAGIVLLVFGIPNWISAGAFWHSVLLRIWLFIKLANESALGRAAILIVGVALLFLPWRKIRGKRYDTSTLRGRTLRLRDELQSFLDSAPPDTESHTTTSGFLQRSSGNGLRVMRLHHGYRVRFEDSINRIVDEFGEQGLRDVELDKALASPQVNREAMYRIVINRLTELADTPEALISAG